ncbi:MAG: hypothetical protein E6Q29_10610 [Alicycliphilus sp.]|nr:MAG: hypothetical protein E6Q29_10610 [Alicycliphilus sp.]
MRSPRDWRGQVQATTAAATGLAHDNFRFLPVLKALSPYRTSHINRFGDYTLDLTRAVEPIDYKIKFS